MVKARYSPGAIQLNIKNRTRARVSLTEDVLEQLAQVPHLQEHHRSFLVIKTSDSKEFSSRVDNGGTIWVTNTVAVAKRHLAPGCLSQAVVVV